MSILVTGGAGYVGSHIVSELLEKGLDVIVVDNLSSGHAQAMRGGRLYPCDLRDRAALRDVFSREDVKAVVHTAASALVGESMENPGLYFENNVMSAVSLLDCMAEHRVRDIVFSSTAALFGEPDYTPIDEGHPLNPTNPYGESKRMVERMLFWYEKIHGIRHISLRYFNVAGAHEGGAIGEDHAPETHLIPILLEVARGKRAQFTLYGADYPTKDGTCVRDYIHVKDLADAHLLALDYLKAGNPSCAFNLGNGTGFTNREVLEAARRVTGAKIPVLEEGRRPGDPAVLVASSQKAKETLGWTPKRTGIEEIIASAWKWHSAHPDGYRPDDF